MKTLHIFFIVLASLLVSCNETDNNEISESANSFEESHLHEVRKVFYAIPSPLESAILIYNSGLQFEPNLLLPTKQGRNYATMRQRAFALGVYGTNLSYATAFNKNTYVNDYFKEIKQLASQLGIGEILAPELIEEVERNINNKDTLMDIISKSYVKTHELLRENSVEELSIMIMAGGWIEAMYLATNSSRIGIDNAMFEQKIAEQSAPLEGLIALCEEYPDVKSLDEIKSDLLIIQSHFKTIVFTSDETEVEWNDEDSTTPQMRIHKSQTAEIPKNFLSELSEISMKIRNKYVQI